MNSIIDHIQEPEDDRIPVPSGYHAVTYEKIAIAFPLDAPKSPVLAFRIELHQLGWQPLDPNEPIDKSDTNGKMLCLPPALEMIVDLYRT